MQRARYKRSLGFLLICVWFASIAVSNAQTQLNSQAPVGKWPAGLATPKAVAPAVRSAHALKPQIRGGAASNNQQVVGIFFFDEDNTASICSGLLITSAFILTAKHCTCHGGAYLVTSDADMLSVSPPVIWNNAKLYGQLGSSCASLQTLNPSEGNDLALLKLDQPMPGSVPASSCPDYGLVDNIRPEASWSPRPPPALAVSGYGRDPDGTGSQEQRRQANLSFSSLTCVGLAERQLGCVPFRELILGANNAGSRLFDSCGGDSGGPAFIVQNGKTIPIAAVSRALPNQPAANCGGGGIYTQLGRADVVGWLRNEINSSCKHGN